MVVMTRASSGRASGVPAPPGPVPFEQSIQPQPPAAFPVLGGTMPSPVFLGTMPTTVASRSSPVPASTNYGGFSDSEVAAAFLGVLPIQRHGIHGSGSSSMTNIAASPAPSLNSSFPVPDIALLGQAPYGSFSQPPIPTIQSVSSNVFVMNSLNRVPPDVIARYNSTTIMQPASSLPRPVRQSSSFGNTVSNKELNTAPRSTPPQQSSSNSIIPFLRPVGSSSFGFVIGGSSQNAASSNKSPIKWTLSTTFNKDIKDPRTQKLVTALQQYHPWAPAKICHSMLVGCRNFDDANLALGKLTTEDATDTNKVAPLTAGIFSRAERRRALASSTETKADRDRASFVASAVLYKAFAAEAYHYTRVLMTYTPRNGFINFPKGPSAFSPFSIQYPPSKQDYPGTFRGKALPVLDFCPDDKNISIRSIGIAYPYRNESFEELRFGDYIRGRKKAPHLFDNFKMLPGELRSLIWKFSMQMQPRTVELRFDFKKAWTTAKIPTALSICRESRYEALKRYTLSFGMENSPSKVFFDFQRDTLFLTYEKWHGDADYEGQMDVLSHRLFISGEASKVRSLAIDRDLVEILAGILESEEEDWYADGDDGTPMPEIEIIPCFQSLESLVIVKTAIDGFWDDHATVCGCALPDDSKECVITRRGRKNDNAEFVAANAYVVADRTQQEYYKQTIAQVKENKLTWSVPALSYMIKRKPTSSLKKDKSENARQTCACGECWSDSE